MRSAGEGFLALWLPVFWISFLGFFRGGQKLTGPKAQEIKVETLRINCLLRSPKVQKLGFEPVRKTLNPRP